FEAEGLVDGRAAGKQECAQTERRPYDARLVGMDGHVQSTPASFRDVRTRSWYCDESGTRGRRYPSSDKPISATAHLTRMGLASINNTLVSRASLVFSSRVRATSP